MIPGQVKALKWVVESTRAITYGIVQAGEDVEGGVPYIRPVDMSDEQGIKTETLRTTSKEIANSYKRSEVKANDLVVSIGPSYGKVMVVPADLEGANLTQGTARVAVDGFKARSRYVFWALRSSYVASQWSSQINATTFGGLNLEPLANTKVFLPDIATQEKLASFLDRETARIDALVAKKTRFIELLREKRQALITHAVTKGLDPNVKMKDSGVEWLGEVPEHWDVKPLKYVGAAIIGLTYSPDDVVGEDEGVLVLRASNIQNGRLVLGDNVYVRATIPTKLVTREGDILICSRNGSRALIGKNALIGQDASGLSFGAFTTVFRSAANQFVYYVLNSALFKFQSGRFLTTTINQLTTETLTSFEVPLPPPREQIEISEWLTTQLEKLDALASRTERSIELLKERRSALITAAVTGQIDLRETA